MEKDPFSLDRMEDIVQGDPVSWYPPAPFWWCVLALAAAWILYTVTLAIYRWYKNAYRREALRELAELHPPTALGVSSILKRVALVSFPREDVASLSGETWLTFLTATCDRVDFSKPSTRSLGSASSVVEASPMPDPHQDEIVSAARSWITMHRVELPR